MNLSYRSVASHTPLFGSSFTSKFLTLSLNSDFGSSSIYVRETQDKLMFQPTLDSRKVDSVTFFGSTNRISCDQLMYFVEMEAGAELKASVEQFQSNTEYSPASETQSAVRKLKRPLFESSAEASVRHAYRNIRKRDKREELLKEKADDKSKTINLYRRYRRGEIPDIEIPRSALIEPLIALAKVRNFSKVDRLLMNNSVQCARNFAERSDHRETRFHELLGGNFTKRQQRCVFDRVE